MAFILPDIVDTYNKLGASLVTLTPWMLGSNLMKMANILDLWLFGQLQLNLQHILLLIVETVNSHLNLEAIISLVSGCLVSKYTSKNT